MNTKNKALTLFAIFAPVALIAGEAIAYTTGTNTGNDAMGQFDNFLGVVVGWIDGPLGTLLAVIALGVGLTMGIMQQSLVAGIVGIFFAALVSYGPAILQGVAGAAESAL